MLTATTRTRRLRVAVLCSHRAPGLLDLIRDPTRDRDFQLAALLTTDRGSTDAGRAQATGVPVIRHDIRDFYRNRGRPLTDLDLRRDFDRRSAALLEPYEPDLVLAVGYLHLLTPPMLEAFEGRIANIHDSDLLQRDENDRPLYTGLRATREAILAGEPETRSTAHLVTDELDGGPSLARSWPFPVHPLVKDALRLGAADILKAYAYAHREWMMRLAWGPLLSETLRIFDAGPVRCLDGRAVVGRSLGPVELVAPELPLPQGDRAARPRAGAGP